MFFFKITLQPYPFRDPRFLTGRQTPRPYLIILNWSFRVYLENTEQLSNQHNWTVTRRSRRSFTRLTFCLVNCKCFRFFFYHFCKTGDSNPQSGQTKSAQKSSVKGSTGRLNLKPLQKCCQNFCSLINGPNVKEKCEC